MSSSNQSRQQCARARPSFAALATLGAVLVLLGGGVPAAANGAVKTVKCALPFTAGGPNLFCTGAHQILYTTEGFTNNNSTITAELVAFDELGNVLGSIPVHSGDLAQLASKTQPDQFKMTTVKNLHTVSAPIPMLRVTADDGVDKVTAYCSNIPLARVFEPDGTVVTESEGDVTHVLAAIPQVDPGHLALTVDGVNIFVGLGIANPASCTPASPCGGNFLVGASNVSVSNLVVDVGPINTLHRNTVTLDIAGLGCGGHLFAVNGLPIPGSRPKNVVASCHTDPIADKGRSSGFAIDITKPASQETGVPVPVKVRGEVCSGLAIAGLNINGIDVPVTGQTLIPGNGTTSADTYKLAIKMSMPETNLAQDFASGNAAPGADAGSNLLIVAATDAEGNRTFSRLFYATHTTLNPGVPAALLGNLGPSALDALAKKLNHVVSGLAPLPSTVQVDNAFLIGLSPQAIQQQFDKRCPDADAQFKAKAKTALEALSIPNVSVDPPCSCAASVGFSVGTVTFTGNTTCTVDFSADKFTVTIALPTVNIPVHGSGHCGDCIVGIGSETTVNGDLTMHLSNSQVKFDVTKDQLLNPTSPQPTSFVSGTTSTTGSIGVDTCEFPAGVCNFVLDVLAFIANGDWPDFTPDIDVSNVADFKNAIAASEPDPIKLAAIKIDEQKVANFDQTLAGKLTSVQINSNGILAGLRGSFATNVLPDPEILGTPGALITQPPLPSLPILGASDAVIALSTDTINMLFAGMTVAGKLKESCQPSGKTLGDLLPVDCDSLVNDASPIATALQQGVCHGIRLHNCDALPGPSAAIKQGACHGTRGDNCATILTEGNAVEKLLEKSTCQNTPNLNLRADHNILFCTRQDIPPRMALRSGGGGAVSTTLRLKALSVALVLDRQGDDLDGTLDTTPQCFGTGAPRLGDCALYEACLDMNFNFEEQFVPPSEAATCGGLPGFKAVFKEVQVLHRQPGVVCSGSGLAADDALLLDQTASSKFVKMKLPKKARDASPPICMEGLSLGNFVTCGTPQLLAIGTGTFKDYLGVTCAITATP